MRIHRFSRHAVALIVLGAALAAGPEPAAAQQLGPQQAVILVKVGKEKEPRRVVIGLYDEAAPAHVENFKDLVRRKYYRGMRFHRTIADTLVQTGDPYSKHGPTDRSGTGGPGWTVPAEIRLPHTAGAVAMARLPDEINPARASNGGQFFVVLRPMPDLNGQYTVFGRVLEGLEELKLLSRSPADSNNFPLENIRIQSIVLEPVAGSEPAPQARPQG